MGAGHRHARRALCLRKTRSLGFSRFEGAGTGGKKSGTLTLWSQERDGEKAAPGLQEVQLFPEPQVPTSCPVKALLIAPSGHPCIQGCSEEAAGLHVSRDLLQSLRVREKWKTKN